MQVKYMWIININLLIPLFGTLQHIYIYIYVYDLYMWWMTLYHPPPMCSIHLDDVMAAILRQNTQHTPATGGEETEWWSESVYEDD